MSHVSMGRVASCHTYGVMSHMRSHVTHIDVLCHTHTIESRHTYQWVMPRHVTHMESCHVMSHITSHVTHIDALCHTYTIES